MTITITLPRFPLPAVAEHGLRMLSESAALAIADACGVGLPVRLLVLGVKLARSATQD